MIYDEVDPQSRQYLQDSAAYINARRALIYDLMVQIGMKLLEVKATYFDQHRHPSFMAWCAEEFDDSYETLLNYMNVARHMGNLNVDQHNLMTMTALYKLSRRNTPEEAREMALELTQAGQKVDYDAAWVLANAPTYLRQKFVDCDVTRDQAISTTKSLKKVDTKTRQFCETFGITDPQIVEALDSHTMLTIVEDDGQLNGIEWNKPIGSAVMADWERWRKDRQQMHIDESQGHITTLKLKGRLFVEQLGASIQLYASDLDETLRSMNGAEVRVIVKAVQV